jgi:hypothetical protein
MNDRISFSSGDVTVAFDGTLASDRSGIGGAPAAPSSRESSYEVKRTSDHNCVKAPPLNCFGLLVVERRPVAKQDFSMMKRLTPRGAGGPLPGASAWHCHGAL